MLAQGTGGSVTTITAALADNPIAGIPASIPMITKGGLDAVTLSLANEYAKDHIRFNAVAPGVVDTPLHTGATEGILEARSPMGTISAPEDIAEAVIYLAEASPCNRGGAARGRRCARGPMVARQDNSRAMHHLEVAGEQQTPRERTVHEVPYSVPHYSGRWSLDLLPRSRAARCAPAILFLHGLPSSSRMFQPLLTRLADDYHLVAPDYPGFGHSDWPDPKQFAYTFDHIASVMEKFTQALGLSRYTLYMQDYGGPVGFRMALAHPERVEALIVQDAVAHNEGLGANWATRRAFWADRPANEDALRKNLLSLAATKTRHVGDDPNVELYDPDLWTDEYAFLNCTGTGADSKRSLL